MKVSAVVVTRDRPTELARAVNSVVAQTRKPDELVVCDDCSTEDIAGMVREVVGTSMYLKIIRNEYRVGANRSRNLAVSGSSGEVVMFLDDDDAWTPSKVQKQLGVFETHDDIGLVYSRRAVVSRETQSRVLYEIGADVTGMLYPQILFRNWIGTTSSVALKRAVFEQVGGFDEVLPALQDWDLWVRCCQATKVGAVNEVGVVYTVGTGGNGQISCNTALHEEAAAYLLDKYSGIISSQGWLNRRRIRSKLWQSVAKASAKEHGSAFKLAVRSLAEFPDVRAIALLFPPQFVTRLRGRLFDSGVTRKRVS